MWDAVDAGARTSGCVRPEGRRSCARGTSGQEVFNAGADEAFRSLGLSEREALNEQELAEFAQRPAGQRRGRAVQKCFERYKLEASRPTRFARGERVLCQLGANDRPWAAGNVVSTNETDPQNPDKTFPYVVKIDPPESRLISVPGDDNRVVRAEVCFGKQPNSLWFTVMCLRFAGRKSSTRRFTRRRTASRWRSRTPPPSGDYKYTAWAPRTVLDVDYDIVPDVKASRPDTEWSGEATHVPYRVQLDSGEVVLAHQDEHWLVHDLALQPPGPRQSPDVAHDLKRISTRQRADGTWEAVDHHTRKKRNVPPPDPDDEE